MAVRRDARWFARRDALRAVVDRVPVAIAWLGVCFWACGLGVAGYALFVFFLASGGAR